MATNKTFKEAEQEYALKSVLLGIEEAIDNPPFEEYLYYEIENLKSENAELKARLDKSIELPCKVGDTVYKVNERYPCEIQQIVIIDDDIYFEWASFERSYEITECWDEGSFKLSDINKIVFLTFEECEQAEQALEEMEK